VSLRPTRYWYLAEAAQLEKLEASFRVDLAHDRIKIFGQEEIKPGLTH